MLVASLVLGCGASVAAEVRVAVAANFAPVLEALVQRYEQRSGHHIVAVSGSTGKHYAQIRNGAPFDVFLAADTDRPALLEEAGISVRGSRFTYAVGRLFLWSPHAGVVDPAGNVLKAGDFTHVAIANPALAPYGRAARQVLEARGLWHRLRDRIVRGENIAQAHHFVASGNAELGFVAASQIRRPGHRPSGSWWEVPRDLHDPIEQQAVLLRDTPATRALLRFLRSEEAHRIIAEHGYEVPGGRKTEARSQE